jgi:hypothetical protein
MKDIFVLPSQHILNRWINYAKKKGFHTDKKPIGNENLKAHAARPCLEWQHLLH